MKKFNRKSSNYFGLKDYKKVHIKGLNKIQTTGSKKVILSVCCVIVVHYGESVTSVNPHSALVIQRRQEDTLA